MADYGIKVSNPGYDVLTAGLPNLAFTSKYYLYKIKSQGSGTITVSSGNGSVDINHGLSSTPAFLVYMENVKDTGYRYLVGGSDLIFGYWRAYADVTKIRIENLASPLTDGGYDYYYYIFYDAQ